MADDITSAIAGLTHRLHAYRVFENFKRGNIEMPIKWNITGKAMRARGIMDQISAEYDRFTIDGEEHLGDVKGLRGQLGDMKDDLYSAANVMGNGGGNGSQDSGEAAETPKTAPAIQQPEPPKPAPAATPASPASAPAVAVEQSSTFPDQQV